MGPSTVDRMGYVLKFAQIFRTFKIITSELSFVTRLQSAHVIYIGGKDLFFGDFVNYFYSPKVSGQNFSEGLTTIPTLRIYQKLANIWTYCLNLLFYQTKLIFRPTSGHWISTLYRRL